MDINPLVKKLMVKPGMRMLVLNAPPGFVETLHPLPQDVQIDREPDGQYDFVLLFVRSRADIDQQAPFAISAVHPDALLWMAYPKKTSQVKTDISRDFGWDTVHQAGYTGIFMIAIDDTWSAMRFRPLDKVGK